MNAREEGRLELVKDLILSEVNVKELEIVHGTTGVFTKHIKPNFKTLGPKFGKQMKAIAQLISGFTQDDIVEIEVNGNKIISLDSGDQITLELTDVEIQTKDIPEMLVMSDAGTTVALDIIISDDLKQEGIARELINRIQNIRISVDRFARGKHGNVGNFLKKI